MSLDALISEAVERAAAKALAGRELPRLMSVAEVAELMGCSTRAVAAAYRRGAPEALGRVRQDAHLDRGVQAVHRGLGGAVKPRALDLFCGAGGATRGLQMAGFHVTGIDSRPQPRYVGDAFIRADALRPPVDLRAFDFIWASPPCQAFTALRNMWNSREHPNLIPATREMLKAVGVPYAIENVEGAPLEGNVTMLCGTMFGLEAPDGSELRRHRIFETSFSLGLRPPCYHGKPVISVHGGKARDRRRSGALRVTGTGSPTRWISKVERRRAISVCGHSPPAMQRAGESERKIYSVQDAQHAMGIDWMPMSSLSQAIPPAYSEWIGRQALQVISQAA